MCKMKEKLKDFADLFGYHHFCNFQPLFCRLSLCANGPVQTQIKLFPEWFKKEKRQAGAELSQAQDS